MIIEIDNLTPEQELAITDYFANWLKLGEKGVSKWTAYYYDGGGDFNPEILINNEEPKQIEEISRKKCRGDIKIKVAPTRENGLEETIWVDENDVYMIDPFDVQIDYTKLI